VNPYYPAYLDLRGRRCVVIGAGVIAERKVEGLLEAGAAVTVVSPEATDAVAAWAAEGRIGWERRGYVPGDLAGAWLAVAATDDNQTNRAVHAEAEAGRVLLNVVDVTDLCSFIAPATASRGPVTVAISTGGASPALARKLRTQMASDECRCLGWADAAGVLAGARRQLRESGQRADPETWQAAMDEELLALVRGGHEGEARERLLTALRAGQAG
jgi:precorrin-2 dehydrogenase/sirohydrochlorin ferrochelatase